MSLVYSKPQFSRISQTENFNIMRFSLTVKSWSIWFIKIPIKESSIVRFMSVHAWSNIACLTNILHNTYITHYHMHNPLRIEIRTLVATMECSTVAGAGDAVSRNKGGTELAAIALAWFTLDDLFLRLLKVGPTYLLRKDFWLGEQNNWRAGKHHAHAFSSVEDRQNLI